jgi:hypothetical protein
VKQFEATLLCSQDIKQMTPSLSSLTSKWHSLYVLLVAWQVKQDFRLVVYVLDLQLLSDVECCVLFLLVYMKNELQTATFCNLQHVMHHFFVHFLYNRCGWTVWYFRFTSPTARLYCIIHFGFDILGPFTVRVCIILSWNMDVNNSSVLLLQLIPTIPLHSAVKDSPFAGFFAFTTWVIYSPFRHCSCNNDPVSKHVKLSIHTV